MENEKPKALIRSVDITLDTPVTVEGETFSSLKMRRAKVKDRLAADKKFSNLAEREINFFANLCDIPPSVVMELDESDYVKVAEAYSSFSPSSQP